MENNTFSYNYSATKNKEVESIRRKYMPHEESKLERLKKLDLCVQMAVQSKAFASVSWVRLYSALECASSLTCSQARLGSQLS